MRARRLEECGLPWRAQSGTPVPERVRLTRGQVAIPHNDVVTRRNSGSTIGRYPLARKRPIAAQVANRAARAARWSWLRVPDGPVIARTFTDCMEQLQEGYVAAVAATAGCTVQPMARDLYGTDIMIIRSGESYVQEEVSVLAQLKNTTTVTVDPSKPTFSYKMKHRKHFEKLALYRKSLKSIIVVMTTTPDQSDWTKSTHEALAIQYCCYWRSLVGEMAPEGVGSPTIHVPTTNVFDAQALTQILDKIERGEDL